MPVATVNLNPEREELKSLPPTGSDEGGYVVLRRLPYGQILARRDMSSRMIMEQKQRRRGQKAPVDDTQRVEMELMQEVTRLYEFANCVMDHNLTDPGGRKLDFSKRNDVFSLDPKVAQEIEEKIDNLNRELDEDDVEDFIMPSYSSSADETTT